MVMAHWKSSDVRIRIVVPRIIGNQFILQHAAEMQTSTQRWTARTEAGCRGAFACT